MDDQKQTPTPLLKRILAGILLVFFIYLVVRFLLNFLYLPEPI